MTSKAISKLSTLLATLKPQAQHLDQANADKKAHRLLEDNPMFSINMFRNKSDKYLPYILEVEAEIKELNYLLNKNSTTLAYSLLERIEQQLSCLYNAFSANSTIHREAGIRQEKMKIRAYKKSMEKMMLSSHSLHQKLAEYHEFERRLNDMLIEQTRQLKLATAKKSQEISAQVLLLHQRLGRCRQAISKVERQIEMSEKRTLY